jgi:hypothetical protein
MSPFSCPPDPEETAEFYLLGMLSADDAAAFEDHYVMCAACADILENADAFIRALRATVSVQRR